ncbi:O-antigen ligase [Cryobacterium sp. MP_M5]|uniref:O-antigen ligase family protein n=1 Tax=unclassified Cryobacterium TaxID=2649013 RepID=UPI0018CA7EF1|nr:MULTISPECIES: O-antigen ligase family protein [unclassified Cryobacterium]MBG6058642.1 O-antigen ligase [Cryobacterium sp. MP_M3]MEC5177280.1 O-antigen ligase [Cryobacterium sp. MP_M5]
MLASIAVLPDAFVRWILPKDVLAAVAVAVASAAWARGRLPRWFVGASAVAGLAALLSVLLSAAPGVQLLGRWPRYEGLVTVPVYFGAVWAGARLLGPAAPASKLRSLVTAAASAAILLGAVSMLEAAGARPFASDLARPGALTGNATDQGVLGALFVAVLVLPVTRAWTGARPAWSRARLERGWLTAALALAATTVILSASRAGFLAALTVVVVLVVLEITRAGQAGRSRRRRRLLVGAAAVATLVGGALAVPLTRERLLGSSPLSTQSLQGRFAFWQDSLDVLGVHPLGVGASGFLNANASASTGEGTLDSPHNWLLQVAMAGGFPLLAVVLGIIVAASLGGVRRWLAAARGGTDSDRTDLLAGALAGLAAFGVALLTHFTAPSTTIVAAMLLGILVARGPDGGMGAGSSARVRGGATGIRTVLLSFWAIWLIVIMSAEVPLAAGVLATARGDVSAADAEFRQAQSLRPWDADLAGIAAQSFAAASDAEVAGAAPLAVSWAERSRVPLPGTVATERALAVGQVNSGDVTEAGRTLAALVEVAPHDAAVAVQHAVVLYLLGDISGCAGEVRRALELDPAEPTALRLRDVLFSG